MLPESQTLSHEEWRRQTQLRGFVSERRRRNRAAKRPLLTQWTLLASVPATKSLPLLWRWRRRRLRRAWRCRCMRGCSVDDHACRAITRNEIRITTAEEIYQRIDLVLQNSTGCANQNW